MTPERTREYVGSQVVGRAMTEQWGCDLSAKPRDFNLLRTDGDARAFLNTAKAEYLTVSNPTIASQKPDVPARSVKPSELPDLLNNDPYSEVFMSLLSKETESGLPKRAILFFDGEIYKKDKPGDILYRQYETILQIEPLYRDMQEVLASYGIEPICCMSGRGYHWLIGTNDYKTIERLAGLRIVESSVKGYQAHRPQNSKRDRPISLESEQVYLACVSLQQYVINKVMARNPDVNISDVGEEGVTLDNTGAVRHVGSALTGVFGSLYLKPWLHPYKFDPQAVKESRLLTRVIRRAHGEEQFSLPQLIAARQNYGKAIENLAWSGGTIPENKHGINKLIDEYEKSPLAAFHRALDSEPGDPPEIWHRTYRNYQGIINSNPDLKDIIENANPLLLQPESLNLLVNTLYDRWGSAGHVRAFLRSIYEDGTNYHWGKRFMRHEVAERHATGWVTIILGQRFIK